MHEKSPQAAGPTHADAADVSALAQKKRILIVEDEETLRQLLAYLLLKEGYEVAEAASVSEARQQLLTFSPHLLLVDWMLPGLSGLHLLRKLRAGLETRSLPIMLLTARGREADRVEGLQAGADDYMVKPFSNRELLARIAALLRRVGEAEAPPPSAIPGLHLDLRAHRVTVAGKEVHLSLKEYRLLAFLIKHHDVVLSRRQLLDEVWGVGTFSDERTVDTHIRRVRRALQPHGLSHHIQTVRGVGYRCSVLSRK